VESLEAVYDRGYTLRQYSNGFRREPGICYGMQAMGSWRGGFR
jgi:hypothetical protein